jgi:hypothetical protein
VMVLVGRFHDDMTADHVVAEFLQFLGPLADGCFQCRRGVCGELLFRPRPVVGRGLCSGFASDRNVDPQLLPVSLGFLRSVDCRPMRNGSDGHYRNP